MKQLITILILLLIHNESGDVDVVEKCELYGDQLVVDFGYGAMNVEMPADEYSCELYERVSQ